VGGCIVNSTDVQTTYVPEFHLCRLGIILNAKRNKLIRIQTAFDDDIGWLRFFNPQRYIK